MIAKYVDDRSCEQRAKDKAIIQKLAVEEELTPEEDNRLDELLDIAVDNLGLKMKLERRK